TQFGGIRPRLMVVSACRTAEPYQLLASLAGGLVQCEFPAVLGWGGSVKDVAATRFASHLYTLLAKRKSLEEAVAEARQLLANDPNPDIRADWHMARLYFGAEGGGPVCTGRRRRHWHDANRADKAYLDQKGKQIPVASRSEFVGRRRPLQTVRRNLDERRPTVVHGLGQHGKSSLAARVASRYPSHDPVVVYMDYTPRGVLQAILSTTSVAGYDGAVEATNMITGVLTQADNPEVFGQTLSRLLDGPLGELQTANGKAVQRPIFLMIDDFERALVDPKPGEMHHVRPELAPGLAKVFRAFADGEHNCHLLVTSRFPFTCVADGEDAADKLSFFHLTDMSDGDFLRQARNLAATGVDLAQKHARGTLSPEALLALEQARIAELCNIIPLVFGSPRLMSYAANLRAGSEAAFQAFCRAAEEYRAKGTTVDQGLLKVLEHIAIGKLLALLDGDERELLRRSCVVNIPVPAGVFEHLHLQFASNPTAAKSSALRLLNLGLWNRYENALNPRLGHDHALIDPLVRPLVDPPEGAAR
ncbi:MAG TPA: CHAT domain-containing protein, partial [Urbifossiella sp.]|nr:CHAT domain-containing protein [Urbifossiella sp.]